MPESPSINNERDIAEVINKAKIGNESALETLCKYLFTIIYSYVFYRVRHQEDTEEITSEVVLRIVRNLRTQKGNFYAWVYKIARNAVIDHFRKSGARQELSYDELQKELPEEDNKKDILKMDRLKEAIGHLTKEQADVITLKFIQEYSNSEIARIMGKSVGAIKVLQYRALKALREYFRKKGYEIKD